MESSSVSNPEAAASIQSGESKRKSRGKRKIRSESRAGGIQIRKNRWRTVGDQQTYSLKLIEALRRARRNQSPAEDTHGRVRAVRDTADRVLAVAGKGRTRWSRALIASRLRMKLVRRKKAKVSVNGIGRSKKPLEKKRLPALERKMRVLGRLVPGCQKLSLSNLLEETADYIAALEMQVRAMTALTGLLDGAEPEDNPANRLHSNE